jgi:two-component system, sensor histidine kinase and response regulator
MFWNEITIIPIRNAEQMITHFMGIQFDVSPQREYNELQAAYDLINEQMKSIEEQAELLKAINTQHIESSQRLSDLTAMLAHDLQNPLSAMMSFVEVMRDTEQILTQEERTMYGDIAYETAERMLPLVKRLMDVGRFAKQELEPLHLFTLNISSLVELLVSGYGHRASSKRMVIEYDIPGPLWVLADETSLETSLYEVVDNLISNALKYTPHGKRVGVRLYKNDDNIRLEVWDEGQGLSAQDKERIFKNNGRFSARPTGGESSTGLGLVVVQSMIQRMKGRVWCESEHGQGARFYVELPAVHI